MTDRPRVRSRDVRRQIRWVLWEQLPLLVALVLLWMLLWGTVSWISVLSGIAVALVVTRVFYLPPVELSGRVNFFWGLVFLGRFLGEVFVASFLVASQALRPRGVRTSAVVAVDLVTRSDFIMTLTSIAISLIPGSIVLEVDRERSILYLHAVGIEDLDGVEALKRKVLSVERGIVRAVGSRADMERAKA